MAIAIWHNGSSWHYSYKSSSKFKVIGHSSRSQEQNVAKVVSATSSDSFRIGRTAARSTIVLNPPLQPFPRAKAFPHFVNRVSVYNTRPITYTTRTISVFTYYHVAQVLSVKLNKDRQIENKVFPLLTIVAKNDTVLPKKTMTMRLVSLFNFINSSINRCYIKSASNFRCSLDNAKKSFYRAFNAAFGKVGRIASDTVVVEILSKKCYCVQLVLDTPLRMRVARPTVEIARRDSFSLDSALDAVS